MFLKRRANPRTLIRISMVFLLIFFALGIVPRFAQPLTPFWDGVLDGSRGALLGAALALMIWGRRALVRRPLT